MAPKISEEEIDDLIYFARAGEDAELNELLSTISTRENVSAGEILMLAKDEGKSTCLHMATGNGHLEIVKTLLGHLASRPKEEKQAYLDAPNEYGNTGLHWAALGGHLDVVKVLVAEGAAPALANDKNYVPLDLASFNGHVAVADYFLDQAKSLESEADPDGAGLGGAVGDMEIDEGGEEDETKLNGGAGSGAACGKGEDEQGGAGG